MVTTLGPAGERRTSPVETCGPHPLLPIRGGALRSNQQGAGRKNSRAGRRTSQRVEEERGVTQHIRERLRAETLHLCINGCSNGLWERA